jgi:catechol 2,3-dioxygenase-like lactoylglutathione lyase family enzyme
MGVRLHHVNVVTPHAMASDVIRFYSEVLGLERIPKDGGDDPRGAWFRVGADAELHVSVRDGSVHPDAHFALHVDDFPALAARVAEAGLSWSPASTNVDGERAFTRDPAGNRIELLGRKGERPPPR